MTSLERNYFWGCTLSKDKPEVQWHGTDDNETSVEVDILNQLALSQACLGSKAKDSSHVVQVTTKGVNESNITQPIIILGSGVRQVQCRLEFNSEATFKLIEGTGPVYLSGSHIQVLSEAYVDSDEEDSMDEEMSPNKPPSPPKRQNSPKSGKEQRPPAKKAKLEIFNGNDASSDEEPDQLIPITIKDDKAKVAKGKDDKTKKPVVDTKSKKPTSAAASKKAKLADEDDEDDSEDDEDDDDDDDDDDFDVDSDDDEDDEDASDSDDDDDDEDDDDDDDDEDDEDDDDDFDEESDKEDKGLTQNKGKPAKSTPGKKKEDNKTPGKKQTPNKPSPKKGNMEASVNLPKTPDLNTVKQKLLKSPNLPKKMDKFKNFMKTNMKISDEKVVKDLWTFVRSNKK